MQCKCLAKSGYLGVCHGSLDECEVTPKEPSLMWSVVVGQTEVSFSIGHQYKCAFCPSSLPCSFLSSSSHIIPALLCLVSLFYCPVNLWPGPQKCGQRRPVSVLRSMNTNGGEQNGTECWDRREKEWKERGIIKRVGVKRWMLELLLYDLLMWFREDLSWNRGREKETAKGNRQYGMLT